MNEYRDPLNTPNIRDDADFFVKYADPYGSIELVTIERPERPDDFERTYTNLTPASKARIARLTARTWPYMTTMPNGWLGMSTRGENEDALYSWDLRNASR